ncbi:MAG: cyclopropane-fatty-acyl-phospholipid synthase family protein [Candidatus Kapaibacterium sp.]
MAYDATNPIVPKKPGIESRYRSKQVPITTFIEDYIDGRVDLAVDFRDFLNQRNKFIKYSLVADHLKFIVTRFIPEITIHSKAQDERIVRDHYDRGNDFFASFLGDRMIYTSAFFKTGEEDLETAQDQKMDLVCRKIQMERGDRHLDIGCGWGTLAMHAARDYGTDSTGVTLAQDGTDYGNAQIARNGVSDHARIIRSDYRDIPNTKFDKITCLEMAEHVGIKNFLKFMKQINGLLEDDGLFYLQIAGLRARTGLFSGLNMEDIVWGLFMSKYIFPGADASMPLSFVVKNLEKAGFEIHSVENVGIHYSRTIDLWYDNWMRNKSVIVNKYGERWFRLWQVFLGWSVHIAAQGASTCFQLVCNKNLDEFNRKRWFSGVALGERDLELVD